MSLHALPLICRALGRTGALALGLAIAAAALPSGLVAQAASSPLSENVAVNLINRLVKRGALTADDGAELIKLAEADAAAARSRNAAPSPAQEARQPVGDPAAGDEEAVRVTYVPEIVKAQIRDEVRQDVMAQARRENWASPRAFPEWTSRFEFFGDFRFRLEGDLLPAGNDNTGAFPNFNAINTGSPFDVSGNLFSPQYNVDQNRQRVRIRARLGTAITLGDGFTSGLRFGTGENNSPVTENQSLGSANQAQGGNFSKYAVWLDRGFLRYEVGTTAEQGLTFTVGRFDNPFFATTMLWAADLGFDGAVIQGRRVVADGLTAFITIGAFPVFNTDLNFASNQPAKFKSEDKWLYAAQAGATWRLNSDFEAKFAGAYYYFANVEGKLSAPYTPLTAQDAGSTDDSRPAFAQTGNTYMALRNIVPTVLNNFGAIDQYQYFGLASPFHELDLTGRLDYNHFAPFQLALTGEYVNNLAFHRHSVGAKAVNNLGAAPSAGGVGAFEGGNAAWFVGITAGAVAMRQRWDWNVSLDYRNVQSDALVDGFCDADFGGTLLGTNHKGYTLSGNMALAPRVWLTVRWMSATGLAGPTFRNDLLLFDINSKF